MDLVLRIVVDLVDLVLREVCLWDSSLRCPYNGGMLDHGKLSLPWFECMYGSIYWYVSHASKGTLHILITFIQPQSKVTWSVTVALPIA